MSIHSQYEVLVVGAGPVGLFAAVLLAQRNIKVAVIDRAKRTNTHSYALAVHAQTLRMIANAGVDPALLDAGYRVDRMGLYEGPVHHATIRLDKIPDSLPYLLVLPQSSLEAALERRLEELGVKVFWDHELLDLNSDRSQPVARIGILDEVPQGYPAMEFHRMITKTREVKANFVIGADGYHSAVRRMLDIDYGVVGDVQRFSLYEFPTIANLDHELRVVMNEKTTEVLWPLANGRCRWNFEISSPMDHAATLERLEELILERAPFFDQIPQELHWCTQVRFEKRLVNRFGEGCIWLAGDAAHLTGPVGAQSMNMGLREAHELAWRLFDILRNRASENLLEIYNHQCRKEWSDMLGISGTLVPEEGTGDWIKNRAARLRDALPATGKALDSLLLQMGIRVA